MIQIMDAALNNRCWTQHPPSFKLGMKGDYKILRVSRAEAHPYRLQDGCCSNINMCLWSCCTSAGAKGACATGSEPLRVASIAHQRHAGGGTFLSVGMTVRTVKVRWNVAGPRWRSTWHGVDQKVHSLSARCGCCALTQSLTWIPGSHALCLLLQRSWLVHCWLCTVALTVGWQTEGWSLCKGRSSSHPSISLAGATPMVEWWAALSSSRACDKDSVKEQPWTRWARVWLNLGVVVDCSDVLNPLALGVRAELYHDQLRVIVPGQSCSQFTASKDHFQEVWWPLM